ASLTAAGCELDTITAGLAAVVGSAAFAGGATAIETGFGPTVVPCGRAAALPRAVPTIETAIDCLPAGPLARSGNRCSARYPIAHRRPAQLRRQALPRDDAGGCVTSPRSVWGS